MIKIYTNNNDVHYRENFRAAVDTAANLALKPKILLFLLQQEKNLTLTSHPNERPLKLARRNFISAHICEDPGGGGGGLVKKTMVEM